MSELPPTCHAIQFTGADRMVHNAAKPLPEVGPYHVVIKIDSCGICFSDTKLLHAFDKHPRKSQVTRVVLDPRHETFDPTWSQERLLAEIAAMPQYAPGEAPTVPGHEPTGHIVAVGSKVTRHRVGERVLVQTDYRHLPTQASNAAFGYNFEGALQEYVTVDERAVIEPHTGERFLIPVAEGPTCSAISLIEPWACVEAAYTWGERQRMAAGGRLLVVVADGRRAQGLAGLVREAGPDVVVAVGELGDELDWFAGVSRVASPDELTGEFDDIVYFGADAGVIEALAGRLAFGGVLDLVLGGERIARPVSVDVGRVHYDLIRVIGTTGFSAADTYARIPADSELRPGDRMAIIGAAGPMGLMHTMRTAVSGIDGVSMDAVDVDDSRLAHLAATVAPVAARHGVPASFRNSATEPLEPGYTYLAVMVPSPALIAQAVGLAGDHAIVNAFAGFAIGTLAPLDLNAVAERGVYLVGTSGSRIQDMKAMLAKVESGVLDTNVSLDAVCGMAGVEAAIESVNNRTSTGKIMVYPALADLGLVRLVDLPAVLPDVAAAMDGPRWTKAAEDVLLAR